jgi:hypothetical protein
MRVHQTEFLYFCVENGTERRSMFVKEGSDVGLCEEMDWILRCTLGRRRKEGRSEEKCRQEKV